MTVGSYVIPKRVRRGALKIVGRWSATPEDIMSGLEARVGFETIGELIEALDDRIGDGAAEEFEQRMLSLPTPSSGLGACAVRSGVSVRRDVAAAKLAERVLLALPDEMFSTALEGALDIVSARAFESMRSDEAHRDVYNSITTLFSENGVPYAFDGNARLAPTGSATMVAATLQPSLDVLADPRLADSRSHLLEAQRRLQEPDPDEAVDEARMAVEYGLLALLDASGSPRPTKHQPNDLFHALVTAQIVSRDAEELVLSVARFRGRTAAGHAGNTRVQLGEAEAAVGAAAAALLFLAHKLP
jgi:hypothetical protein